MKTTKYLLISLIMCILFFNLLSCVRSSESTTNTTEKTKKESSITSSTSVQDVFELDYTFSLESSIYNHAKTQLSLLEENMHNNYLVEGDSIISKRANLWTYGAYFTMASRLARYDASDENIAILNNAVEELEWYRVKDRTDNHTVYASKNGEEKPAFYDDNVWLVLGFINAYKATQNIDYLNSAKSIMDWIYDGESTLGGIYWREFDALELDSVKQRNTCINGPAAYASLLLYEITSDSFYLNKGVRLYHWTRNNLYDKQNKVYWDNIKDNGSIDKNTFTYNTGTMLSSAVYMYRNMGLDIYLDDIKNILEGSYNVFVIPGMFSSVEDGEFILNNPWFNLYLYQGYFDVFKYIDYNYGKRLENVKKAIIYGLNNSLNSKGFIKEDWSGRRDDEHGYITQTKYLSAQIETMIILCDYQDTITKLLEK